MKRSLKQLREMLEYSVRPRLEGTALGICDLLYCGVTIGGVELRRYRRLKAMEKRIASRIREMQLEHDSGKI